MYEHKPSHERAIEKVNDLTLKLEQERKKTENYDKHLYIG